MEIHSNKNKIVFSENYRNKKLMSFQERVDLIRSELPANKKESLDDSALMSSAKWVLDKQKYIRTAQVVFGQAKDMVGAQAGYLAIFNETDDEVEILVSDTGGVVCAVEKTREGAIPLRGLRKQVLRTLETIRVNDFAASEYAKYIPAGHIVIENVLFSPVIVDGKGWGILGFANKTGGFSPADIRLAALFADFAAMALKNSQAWKYMGKVRAATGSVAILHDS